MTIIEDTLYKHGLMGTFSAFVVTGMLAHQLPADPPQVDPVGISYEQKVHTSESFGTLDTQYTFIGESDILAALVNLHSAISDNQIALDEELERLLHEDIEELLA